MGGEKGSGEQSRAEERNYRGPSCGGPLVSFGRSGAVAGMKMGKIEAGHGIRDQCLKDLMCLIEEGRLQPDSIGEF